MRLLVLAHDNFDPQHAKTGHSVVRYSRDDVVAIVDRSKAGGKADDVLGPVGRGIPIVASVEEGLRFNPGGLSIGIAPVGGALPDAWRADIRTALANGLSLISGLHTFLGEDPEVASLAREHGARIHPGGGPWPYEVGGSPPQPVVWDVRRWTEKRIASGEGGRLDNLVVTHVGTDCGSGKMTTAIELVEEARSRGLNAGFVATGQTGIMVGCDAGVPLDAVVADFAAGAVEKCVLDLAARGFDPIFVEGQGSITHPAYSGVSLSLLHGSFPDVLVMSDEPRREKLGAFEGSDFKTNPLDWEIRANELLLEPVSQGKVAAVSLMTRGLSEKEAEEAILAAEKEGGVPAADVFRGGRARILDAVLRKATELGRWDGRGIGAAVGPALPSLWRPRP